MLNLIFDKTEKGRDEIATRKHKLPVKSRALLVLIDGKQTAEEILKKVGGLGLDQASINELVEAGFIESIAPAVAAAPEPEPVSAEVAAMQETQHKAEAAGLLEEGESQFHAVYNFYTHTIKSTIGLRGFALQMKVESAGSIEDFRALRAQYLEAIFKSKGPEIARSLRDRLDQLLYLGEQPPPQTGPGAF